MSSITQVPLPKLLDLLHIPFLRTPSEEVLSSLWRASGDSAYWFSRSTWSMFAIAQFRQQLSKSKNICVWVPEYFCDKSLVLLRQMGAHIVFYPNNELCHPDIVNFPSLTQANRPDLFLLVHYFGKPSSADGIQEFCKENNSWLIEDAVHVLQSSAGIGDKGDFVLYSPHKHLAIPDGAILIVRKDSLVFKEQKNCLDLFDKVVENILGNGRSFDSAVSTWLFKRMLQLIGVRSRNKATTFALTGHISPKIEISPSMSVFSKRLLIQQLHEMHNYAVHRVNCSSQWSHLISRVFDKKNYRIKLSEETPYLACVDTPDQASAEKLYYGLYNIGVPVSTWPDLAPEVYSRTKQSVGYQLRHRRVYLPVHQSVAPKQIAKCALRLHKTQLAKWSLEQISSKDAWEELWVCCKRKSLSQTWEYGEAKATAEFWKTQHFVVRDEDCVPIALFQILVKGLPGLGGIARINRGPLILQDDVDNSDYSSLKAIAVLVREARRHKWWMIQIAPLLPPNIEIKNTLLDMGFRRQPICPMDSALLSLDCSEEELLMRLNGKWRNCLRKGQKLGVVVELGGDRDEYFQTLFTFYREQQTQKGFEGTSERFLKALFDNQSTSFKFNLYTAFKNVDSKKSVIGVLVVLQFGDIAEYLIGATNHTGRSNQANSVLLWEAILDAKRNGCRIFDVGGLSESTPKGITDFKKGLNPEPYALVGEWRKWFWNR